MTKPVLLLSFVLVCAPAIQAQQERGSDAAPIVLANDKLQLAIGTTGGRFSKIVLRDEEQLSPLAAIGHFLALDGFGAPSDQERALGMPFHGEASRQPVKIIAMRDSGPMRLITMQSVLPLAQETLTRTVEAADGENIIYVTSRLESALTVDRPVSWAEHATIGPPFMQAGRVVVDMPASNCRVRSYKPGTIPGRLVYNHDFKWPMAPTNDGGHADLRIIPTDHNWLDLASCQMDPGRRFAFVTVLHLEKHLVSGYTGDNRRRAGWSSSRALSLGGICSASAF